MLRLIPAQLCQGFPKTHLKCEKSNPPRHGPDGGTSMSKFGTCGLLACQDKRSLKNWEFLKLPYLITSVAQLLPNVAFRCDQGFSLLNPYQDYLLSRWNSGNYNTQELFEEIRACGYTGSYATVSRFTRQLGACPDLNQQKVQEKTLPSG